MAQVTYRGVQYDTNRQAQPQQSRTCTYRGVKYNVEVK